MFSAWYFQTCRALASIKRRAARTLMERRFSQRGAAGDRLRAVVAVDLFRVSFAASRAET